MRRNEPFFNGRLRQGTGSFRADTEEVDWIPRPYDQKLLLLPLQRRIGPFLGYLPCTHTQRKMLE